MKPQFNFIIEHMNVNDVHHIKFIPAKEAPGYEPKTIEVTENQWNELRYHFMMAYDDKNKIERLSYLP
jgi:hypothetical protein